MILDRDPTILSREPGDLWLRTLTKNLASLREHRPEVFALLQSATTAPTNASEDESEEARVLKAFTEMVTSRRAGHAIAVAGFGDGAIIRALAKFAPPLSLGRQQEVNLIEPDLSRLLTSLGEVDLSGPRGPIERPCFAWYVGDAWEEKLGDDLTNQPTKMLPQHTIHGGVGREEIDEGLWRIGERVHENQAKQRQAIVAYYDAIDDEELLAVFSSHPPRKPRVLLLTSQFTTVLQYSTNDSADAFRNLGWETLVATEAEPWHLMSRPAIRAAIASFKPDLVFQIDHLRYELGDEIPAKLPFVCWIQDHLTNLTSTIAGESIGERDFVLTGGTYRYADRYNYPRRQCVDMPKVARAPVLPTSWSHDREDLFYVSHWSMTPEQISVDICKRLEETSGASAAKLMRDCTREMTRVYANGGAMRTDLEVRQLVNDVFARIGETPEPEAERFFVDVLFQRLNNAFYRQQSLLWAGEIADEFGLKLGIYGLGWQKHPQLGRFARGPVTYGPDLEALTRQSKILLQLEPYACYSHQRMLDCVLAGGFALIRDHVLNTLPIRIRKFLDAHLPASVNDVQTARARFDEPTTITFNALMSESKIITDLGDPVEVVRGWQRAGTLGNGDVALPHLDAINFDSYETLRSRVMRYINDDAERARISKDQRENILGRLTYTSALGRANKTIYERLRDTITSTSKSITPQAEAA